MKCEKLIRATYLYKLISIIVATSGNANNHALRNSDCMQIYNGRLYMYFAFQLQQQ